MAEVKVSDKLKRILYDDQYDGSGYYHDEEFDDELEKYQVESDKQVGGLKFLGILCVIGFVLYRAVLNHTDIENIPVKASTLAHGNSYVVQKGDSLWSIVRKEYPMAKPEQKMQEIRRLNYLPGDQIRVGQTLKMP